MIFGSGQPSGQSKSMVEFIAGLRNVTMTELLPFHTLCSEKYESFGLRWQAGDLKPPTKEEMAALLGLFESQQLPAQVVE